MTEKEMNRIYKDEVIKRYLLKCGKAALGLFHFNSVRKFKALKILLSYGKNFKFKRNNVITFTCNIIFLTDMNDKNFHNIRRIKNGYIEYVPYLNDFFINYDDNCEIIFDIIFIGANPVIITI